jgi:hypothetical protein
MIPKDWNKVMFIFNQLQKYYNSFINTNLKIYFILEIKPIYKLIRTRFQYSFLFKLFSFLLFGIVGSKKGQYHRNDSQNCDYNVY